MPKRSIVEEKAAVLRAAQIIVQRQSGLLTDAEALAVPEALEKWAAGMKYEQGQRIYYCSKLYQVMQDVAVSHANQPPGATGMLAVYRTIDNKHNGTSDDPIQWSYGLDCISGLYYSHNEKIYLCKGDMIPCVWPPGGSGMWQWKEIK